MNAASPLYRLKTLPAGAKAGIVAAGYAAALALAYGVVSIYLSRTSGPDRDTYAAMYAFGDALLFLGVFGAASTMPTGLAFVFLWQRRNFWFAFCAAAFLAAMTGLVAIAVALFLP
jgi:hypothetical protein